ncbi:MAG: tetratricopeptide repeat protein [Alphaproteobacteria bacterium]|nr:tetratricopeptide repeat protein [Alphaproteobacteria bacterium]
MKIRALLGGCLAVLGGGLTLPARAEPELPSYRDEIVVAEWIAVDKAITAACRWAPGSAGMGVPLSCSRDKLDAVLARIDAFQRTVTPDARLTYLAGLARRHQGDRAAAEATFREVVALDPRRAEAWMDLGELLTTDQRWDEAAAAFTRVTELVPEGPRAWPGWFQLAQVDAHRQQPDAFEDHLRQALRFGFTFRMIEGQPAWQAFWADPTLRPALERMLLVYGDAEIRQSLSGE